MVKLPPVIFSAMVEGLDAMKSIALMVEVMQGSTLSLGLGPYGNPRGMDVSYERGRYFKLLPLVKLPPVVFSATVEAVKRNALLVKVIIKVMVNMMGNAPLRNSLHTRCRSRREHWK